ncbi:MAG: carbon storage regulator CsrA, partial [bacterium]|nr:carbon storage regulator CsrA [bacterium]
MLVLSRKNGQKIIINDSIEITILESKFDNCKIAINAPKDIKIYREEVYRQIQQSNKLSNASSVDAIDSLLSMVDNKDTETKTNKVIIKKKK